MTFTVQAFLYGPTSDVGIIREVDVNKFDGLTSTSKASNTDIKPNPLSADADDAFGYTSTLTE